MLPPLFFHDKSYILLGGIGGLGVDLALWMYQVRAVIPSRDLLLTVGISMVLGTLF
jgi:hypothetical protein